MTGDLCAGAMQNIDIDISGVFGSKRLMKGGSAGRGGDNRAGKEQKEAS